MSVRNSSGSLYIVSTPIGNLDDISRRAIDCLSSVDHIACEDTRRTGRLLTHFNIKKHLISYHNFNESSRSPYIIDLLFSGDDVAVVSDAGTPGISDPAFRIVEAAVKSDIDIFPIPGPSSLLSALVVSGLPLDRFIFEGFLPQKGGKRLKRLESFSDDPRTVVFFESPFRIITLVEQILQVLGDRDISISREITKLHEETIRGCASEVLDILNDSRPRGEYTLVMRGYDRRKKREG